MFLEFAAAIALGFGAAGIAMLLRKLTGNRIPRTIIPIAAGAAMIGFAIWSEYSWFDRTVASLPNGIAVAETYAPPSAFRPWTYAAPFVSKFTAVDRGTIRRNEKAPGQRIVELYLMARYLPVNRVRLLVDCTAQRHARLGGVTFKDDGTVQSANWSQPSADDAIVKTACTETAS
jgi:hypothetical protein